MPLFPTTAMTLNGENTAHPASDSSQQERSRAARIRIKNRRKRYLDSHSEYFTDAGREVADPLPYDRLVRQFMTTEEREAQGRKRGFADTLEADLTRSEAKLEALEHPDPDNPVVYIRASDGVITAIEQDENERPKSKEDGWQQWVAYMTEKFVQGHDDDFDYADVDDNDDYDDQAEEDRGRLEQYLNEESEHFECEGSPKGQTGIQDY